jgi:hypothetical protein
MVTSSQVLGILDAFVTFLSSFKTVTLPSVVPGYLLMHVERRWRSKYYKRVKRRYTDKIVGNRKTISFRVLFHRECYTY